MCDPHMRYLLSLTTILASLTIWDHYLPFGSFRNLECSRPPPQICYLLLKYEICYLFGEVLSILNKHWGILLLDEDLRGVLTQRAQVTYRRGRSIGDRITRSHLDPLPPRQCWLERQINGGFKCRHCKACRWIKNSKDFSSAVTEKKFPIRDFINCSTKGVIYKATCNCPRDYVGKTKREWRRRILEHIGDIAHKRDTPLAKHMELIHGGSSDSLYFQPLELIRPTQRGGDIDRRLLQKEVRWMYTLQSVAPSGINEHISFASYI